MLRLARVQVAGQTTIANIERDFAVLLPSLSASMVALIEAGADGRAAIADALSAKSVRRVPVEEVTFLSPIDRFRRDVLCTGWNYWAHFDEGKGKREGQDVERPKAPTFFTKSPDAIIGPYDNIAYDERVSAKWDYEAELVVIIGKEGRSIPASAAMEYVWGYCLANDVSQRDLQRRHGGQWLKGKSIDGTTPLGPWIVPADQIDPYGIQLQCELNGQVLQDAGVNQMAFPIAELIAELSFGMTLKPGDVLLTGTPNGIGYAREPQILLHYGDTVIVRGSGLGELKNRVASVDLYGTSSVAEMSVV